MNWIYGRTTTVNGFCREFNFVLLTIYEYGTDVHWPQKPDAAPPVELSEDHISSEEDSEEKKRCGGKGGRKKRGAKKKGNTTNNTEEEKKIF